MSWLDKLVRTYDLNAGAEGLPYLYHTNFHAQIIVRLRDGNLVNARIIQEKKLQKVIIPCTNESSTARTQTETPHPLFDSLKYLAGDLDDYVAGNKFIKYFNAYINQLQKWCESSFAIPEVCIVRDYLSRKQLCKDLIGANLLPVDQNGHIILNKPKKKENMPLSEEEKRIAQTPVFSLNADLSKVGILFEIERQGESGAIQLWLSSSVRESWLNYYSTVIEGEKKFCQILGRDAVLAKLHPKIIGHGKLISSNDDKNFTYRGRFETPQEAFAISVEASLKAHSALRWLLEKQGRHDGTQSIVAWAVDSDPAVPDPMDDTSDLLTGNPFDEGDNEEVKVPDTAEAAAAALNKLIAGYSAKLNAKGLCFMAIDAATPGTLAVKLFRDLESSFYLQNIRNWHSTCAWRQEFSKEKCFFGAPAPRDIVRAAYGEMKLDDPRLKSTVTRLLPCILDGSMIPRDIADCVIRRASHPESVEPWEFRKNLGIACSIYRYNNQKRRKYTMALDPSLSSRDYLYGRLLAVADYLEFSALTVNETSRPTNAMRLMARFAERPYSTWRNLEMALTPYKIRLSSNRPGLMTWLNTLLGEIHQLFSVEDFENDRPLSGEYLLGYYCQRQDFFTKKNDKQENPEQ